MRGRASPQRSFAAKGTKNGTEMTEEAGKTQEEIVAALLQRGVIRSTPDEGYEIVEEALTTSDAKSEDVQALRGFLSEQQRLSNTLAKALSRILADLPSVASDVKANSDLSAKIAQDKNATILLRLIEFVSSLSSEQLEAIPESGVFNARQMEIFAKILELVMTTH